MTAQPDENGAKMGGSFQSLLSQLRHDLKTPIGHIIGYAEMLIEDSDGDEDWQFVEDVGNIRQAGERLLELTNDFLGQAKAKPEDIDPKAIEYRVRIELNHIDGYCEMLEELIEEEERYADIGEDVEQIEGSAKEILVILEQKLPALLAAEAVVEEMIRTDVAPAASPSPSTESSDDTSQEQIAADILVVDDNAANRELLRRRLERQGYRVELAEDGDACLRAVQNRHFDLILLDLLMPGLSGNEVLTKLKEDRFHRTTPVIMISAADDTDHVVKSIMLGAEDYVFKPFNPILLKARISSALEKERLRRHQAARYQVFVSSPGDVIPERRAVKQVLDRLNREFSGEAVLIPVFWEEEPLLATETFQSQILSPRDTDIYVGIFWSRLGSILPDHIRRPDGSRYLSGSEFEFEEAVTGYRETGKPEILVYQKLGVPTVELSDRDAIMSRLDQKERLGDFVEKWFKSEDGESFIAAFHTFHDEEHLEDLLIGHLRKLISRKLSD
jgi:DNA-binding response OmpR family regulator